MALSCWSNWASMKFGKIRKFGTRLRQKDFKIIAHFDILQTI